MTRSNAMISTSPTRLAQRLQMSPQVTFSDYLLCLNFYRKLDQKKFDALLEKVKPVAARDSADLALLMDWMNDNGLAAEVLKWMDKLPAETTDQPPAAIAVAEAFAEVKNWSRLTALDAKRAVEERRLSASCLSGFRLTPIAPIDRRRRIRFSLARGRTRGQRPTRPRTQTRTSRHQMELVDRSGATLVARYRRNPPDSPRSTRCALPDLSREQRTEKTLRCAPAPARKFAQRDRHYREPRAAWAKHRPKHLAGAGNSPKKLTIARRTIVNCAVTYAFSLYGLGPHDRRPRYHKKIAAGAIARSPCRVYVALLLLDENQADARQGIHRSRGPRPALLEEKRLLEEAKAKLAPASPTPSPSPSPSAPAPASTPAPTPTSTPINKLVGPRSTPTIHS